MPGRVRKYLQIAGNGIVDACPGSEVSAICWYWTCRYQSWVRKHPQFADIGLVDTNPGFGSIHNLLDLDLQMPGRGWKYLQLAGYEFADAWSGLEASATCWNWICRCLVRIGSICNLLVLELQMPGRGWKHPQLAGYEFADAYHQVDIKNPTTIAEGLFFMSKKSKMFSWTCGAYCARI